MVASNYKKLYDARKVNCRKWLAVVVLITVAGYCGLVMACKVTQVDIWAGRTQSEANSKANPPTTPVYIAEGNTAYFYAECDADNPGGKDFKWEFDFNGGGTDHSGTTSSSEDNYEANWNYGIGTLGDYTVKVTVELDGVEDSSDSATCEISVVQPETLVLQDEETTDSESDSANGGPPPPDRLYVDTVSDGKGDVKFWIVDGITGETYPWEITGTDRSGDLTGSNGFEKTEVDLPQGDYTLVATKESDEDFERKIDFTVGEIDISACSTQKGCFDGYGQRCTGSNRYLFSTGKEFLEGLVSATAANGRIGNLYVFSEGWGYRSSSGASHNGGFYGDPSNGSGFYGTECYGDHSDARYLSDLESAMSSEQIRFAPNKEIFLEGCHIGEVGSFAGELASMTNRTVTAACGGSSEEAIGNNWVKFRSVPINWDELQDSDYDGWLEGTSQIGKYKTVP